MYYLAANMRSFILLPNLFGDTGGTWPSRFHFKTVAFHQVTRVTKITGATWVARVAGVIRLTRMIRVTSIARVFRSERQLGRQCI